jgi:hypothetical protein
MKISMPSSPGWSVIFAYQLEPVSSPCAAASSAGRASPYSSQRSTWVVLLQRAGEVSLAEAKRDLPGEGKCGGEGTQVANEDLPAPRAFQQDAVLTCRPVHLVQRERGPFMVRG